MRVTLPLRTPKSVEGKESMLMSADMQASRTSGQPFGTCTKPILLLGTSTFASREPIGTTFITVWVD